MWGEMREWNLLPSTPSPSVHPLTRLLHSFPTVLGQPVFQSSTKGQPEIGILIQVRMVRHRSLSNRCLMVSTTLEHRSSGSAARRTTRLGRSC